jgi:putative FmdB family regulatory protein
MPTYEYECTKCGHTYEAFQSITAEPLSTCPQCRGKVRRLIGGGMGIIFKGSGFYTTDYKKSSALTGGNGKGKDGGSNGETGSAKSADASAGSTKSETSAKSEKTPA